MSVMNRQASPTATTAATSGTVGALSADAQPTSSSSASSSSSIKTGSILQQPVSEQFQRAQFREISTAVANSRPHGRVGGGDSYHESEYGDEEDEDEEMEDENDREYTTTRVPPPPPPQPPLSLIKSPRQRADSDCSVSLSLTINQQQHSEPVKLRSRSSPSRPMSPSLSLLYPDTAPRHSWRPQVDAWMKKNQPAKMREIAQTTALLPRVYYPSKEKPDKRQHSHPYKTKATTTTTTSIHDSNKPYSRTAELVQQSANDLQNKDKLSPKLPSPPPESPIQDTSMVNNYDYDYRSHPPSPPSHVPDPHNHHHHQPMALDQSPLVQPPHLVASSAPASAPKQKQKLPNNPPAAFASTSSSNKGSTSTSDTTTAHGAANHQQEPQYTVATFAVSNYTNQQRRRCISCGSDQSPCWRPSWSASAGQLCNSCGLRYKKTGARCVNSECGRIPAKGEWVSMKRKAQQLPNGQLRYACLTCEGDVEVGERLGA